MIKAILWDVDGTLLDFRLAEKLAIKACFERFDIHPCTNGRDYEAAGAQGKVSGIFCA